MEKFFVDQTKCPQCEEPLNTTTGDGNPPKPGDVSFCLYCGCVSVFGDDMQLRLPTKDEMAEFDADPKFHEARKAIQGDLDKRSIH